MGRVEIALVGDADLFEQRLRLGDAFGPWPVQHVYRALDDVLQHGHVAPEVEVLEHHAELGPDAVDLAGAGRLLAAATARFHGYGLAGDRHFPGVRNYKQKETTQQRALA